MKIDFIGRVVLPGQVDGGRIDQADLKRGGRRWRAGSKGVGSSNIAVNVILDVSAVAVIRCLRQASVCVKAVGIHDLKTCLVRERAAVNGPLDANRDT